MAESRFQFAGAGTWQRRGYLGISVALVFFAIIALARFAPAVDETPVAPAAAEPTAGGDDVAVTGDDVEAGALPDDAAASAELITDRAALFSFPTITDGVPRVAKPAQVRGIYLNAWATGSANRLGQLIELANRTEINAFVIDVKEGGEISYRSQVPLARDIGADQAYVSDIRRVLQRLRDNGIYPIARIVVFRDEVLARARPDWAVRHVDGGDWMDSYGHYWVDSFNRYVWDYNIAIAREALELGFSEVQWDYVRFPDVPRSFMLTADFPAREGRAMEDGIREFLQYSREQLRSYDVPVTADVFGLTTSARDDMGIGQQWEKMVDATDVLLPMVYPSHYARGSYGIEQPNAQPFEIVRTAMQHAVRRTAGVPGAAGIRPWLQDFTLGQPRYGPEHVRAQIDGVYEAGLDEWVLWNPGSRYTEAALADASGRAPALTRPGAADVAEPADSTRRPRGGPLGTPIPGGLH
ncbi:MAG TPA: putative glycoside hydrolase [Longimicrobiales bacterium]|nr:putative glycoside hydrolase [Longimicrobiales bacterium]